MLILLWRIPLDFAAVTAAWFLAYFIRPYTDLIPWRQEYFPIENLPLMSFFIPFVLCSALGFVLLQGALGRYKFEENFEPIREFLWLVFSVFVWGMLIVAWYALWRHELIFSRVVLMHAMTFALLFSFLFRACVRLIRVAVWRRGKNRKKIILFGAEQNTAIIRKALEASPQFEITAVFSESELGELNNMNIAADELWRCDPHISEDIDHKLHVICNQHHLHFRFVPQETSFSFARLELSLVGGEIPILWALPAAPTAWQLITKRCFDIFISTIALVVLSPVFLLFAIFVKLDSRGPVFFKSLRSGREGKEFLMWKFRSMIADAEKRKAVLHEKSHRQDGPLFKVKNDPRITRFGKFLRRFSLDELPNLINVWKGNMSLVGPRPHLPDEIQKYENWQKRVLMMKPGMTGLAQISGRSDLPFADEVRLDLYYLQNWNFWLDLKIIIKTFFVVLKKEGAD